MPHCGLLRPATAEVTRQPEESTDSELRLPFTHRQRGQAPRPATVRRNLRPSLTTALAALPESRRPSWLAAAGAALLYRYTGQHSIPVTVRHQRRSRQTSISTATIEMEGDASLHELGARFDAASRSATNGQPATQVMMTWCASGTRVRETGDDEHVLHFQLMLNATASSLELHYNGRHMPAAAARRLADHLLAVLALADDQSARVANLDLHGPAGRQWLATRCDGRMQPAPASPLAQFEQQVDTCPGVTALRYRQTQMDYAELNRQANRLAHYLAGRGVAGERVAVCTSPAPESVVALLAVLKAGACYVPLNPSHPRLRLQKLVTDTRPELVLTQTVHRQIFENVHTVCLDALSDDVAAQPAGNPGNDIVASTPAAIFYTSGTTGRPKGVVLTHANLAHCLAVATERFGFGSQDRAVALAAFSFSISIHELLAPLVSGASLELLDREQVLDPRQVLQLLQQVSVAHIGPGLLRNIVAAADDDNLQPAAFAGLRHLSSGGDNVPPELLQQLQRLFTASELHVIYGCSEVSLMGCSWRVDRQPPVTRTLVGSVFPNMRLRVLDDDDNALPPGVIGDVCFAGGGICAGYLHAGEREQQAFFEHDGQRWYRTGDRGCLDEQGRLELLGRRDFQVQLRGMRIEMAEIEHHLQKAPGVSEAVVMPTQLPGDRHALAGWYVAAGDSSVSADTLRQYLAERLPDYMVPVHFEAISALPLNQNLKVDRRALPAVTLPAARDVSTPRTRHERQLAAIWARVLKRADIGLEDNFLLLGGDSLLAMEMIMLTEREIGARLEGLDVLRESLQVLAAKCDRQAGATREATPERRPVSAVAHAGQSFFFGDADSLHGIWHREIGNPADRAVLICPPLGHEYGRSYFFLKSMAVRLARAGLPVLRFDYYGIGDSLGEHHEASLPRWRADLHTALAELRHRSGRTTVCVLGARLGANLATRELARDPDCRFVLWDPVADPQWHFRQLATMHARRLRRLHYLRNFRALEPRASITEHLGLALNDDCLQDLGALGVDASCADCVVTDNSDLPSADPGRVRHIDPPCHWYDMTRIGTAIVSTAIADALFDALLGDTA